MSADGDIVRETLNTLDAIQAGSFVRTPADVALAALARLEAAEARAFDEGCAAVRDEPVCNVCGENHDRDESAACDGCDPISFGELPERLREVVAQRDALAEALRKIASPQEWKQGDGAPFEIARAALAEAGLKAEVGGVDYSRMDPP